MQEDGKMQNTPNSLRRHIGIFGGANTGKSALFNKILNQEAAIVSDKKGTTTDPVFKAMELIDFGPVVFVDTAGLSDGTELGELRAKKTSEILEKTDYALLLIDYKNPEEEVFSSLKEKLKKYKVPYSIVISKTDTLDEEELKKAKEEFLDGVFVSVNDEESVESLKKYITEKLKELSDDERGLVDGLLNYGDQAVLVIPVDSEAPKGRLILPQVQLIRECIDKGILCHVCKTSELKKMLDSLERVDLVVTDSQAFKEVNEIVPQNINLTSFSILMARQKGDLKVFTRGLAAVETLKDGDCVLISEVCTHNTSHEDIGKVKIPALLLKKTGKKLNFEFSSGNSFPQDLEKYKLIIHCGGCMVTRKAILARINRASEKNIPVVNYGILLSYLTNAYKRQEFLTENNYEHKKSGN